MLTSQELSGAFKSRRGWIGWVGSDGGDREAVEVPVYRSLSAVKDFGFDDNLRVLIPG